MNILNLSNIDNPIVTVIIIVVSLLSIFIFLISLPDITRWLSINTPRFSFPSFNLFGWINKPTYKSKREIGTMVDQETLTDSQVKPKDKTIRKWFFNTFSMIWGFFTITLPNAFLAIELHNVFPYIVAALIIVLLFYPLYGMKIDCKGKTKSGGCIEQFTTDNTTFAGSENEVLEQDEEDTPLITAIKNGTINSISDNVDDNNLIEQNHNEVNSNGSTPLMWASRNGYLDIVNKIIELDLDNSTINTQNNYGKTALIWATKYGHFEVVQALINADADVTLNDSDGKTARDYAQTQDVVLAIDIANEDIKNNSRLQRPDDYTDPAWVNVQLQKIKQEVRFNILREKPELLGNEAALTQEVERAMLESQELEDTILQKAQNIQERNELTKEIKKNLVALGKETTLADMQRTDIQALAAAYTSGEYTQDANTRGALDRYDIQYHDTEETIKKENAAQMLKESNIPYMKDGEVETLNRLYVQNQPHYSSSLSNPVLLLERIHPKKRKYENGVYVPDYENTILLSALRPKLKE